MPVSKCPNGKWRIGSGECIYESKESATRAYIAYLAQHPEKKETQSRKMDEIKIRQKLEKEKEK